MPYATIVTLFLDPETMTMDRVPRRGVRAASLSRSPAGLAGGCQAAMVGSLKIGSSLNGAIVSSVM